MVDSWKLQAPTSETLPFPDVDGIPFFRICVSVWVLRMRVPPRSREATKLPRAHILLV